MYLKGSGNYENYDVTFHYKLNENTLSGHLEYVGKGYVSIGISSDGMMVPGHAIIGLPSTTTTKPEQYVMTSKSMAGVTLDENQSLIDGATSQDDTFTNLTFTSLLDDYDEEEYAIVNNGANYFQWAVGIINGLSMHRRRDSFVLDFSRVCIGNEEVADKIVTSAPTEVVVTSETDVVQTSETDTTEANVVDDAIADPVDVTTVQKETNVTNVFEEVKESATEIVNDIAPDQDTETESVPVEESVVTEEVTEEEVQQDTAETESATDESVTEETAKEESIEESTTKATTDGEGCSGNSDDPSYTHMIPLENDLQFYYKLNDQTSFSAQLIYQGKGYVSWANAPSGMMVYSEAVIGLPSQPLSNTNPGKYALTSLENDGVNLMESQTLLYSNITQTEGTTILQFTKLLQEDGELSINPNGINTFTWAVGGMNFMGYHIKRSSFKIDLSKSCESGEENPFIIAVKGPQPVSLSYWKAHGVLAGISWSIFVPFAIMASWYRDLLGGPIWMKLHLYLNVISCFLTTLSFILSVVAISKSGGQHFVNMHQKIGLTMFIFVVVQTINGYFRPPKNPSKQASLRKIWEKTHKVMGWFLLFASIYEVQSGLKLYAVRSGKDYTLFYWGWVVALVIMNGMLIFWIYIYQGVILQEAVPPESFKKTLAGLGPMFSSSVRYSEKGNLVATDDENQKL